MYFGVLSLSLDQGCKKILNYYDDLGYDLSGLAGPELRQDEHQTHRVDRPWSLSEDALSGTAARFDPRLVGLRGTGIRSACSQQSASVDGTAKFQCVW